VRLLVELSGEHPTLPAAEALAVLGGQEAARDTHLLVLDGASAERAERLGLTHAVSEHLASVPCTREAVLRAARDLDARVGPVFRVRAHRLGEHARDLVPGELERALGAQLFPGRKVSMDGPADEVRVLLGERAHLGLLRARLDRAAYDARAVRFRPFFSPVSLHPRFSRALCNLARVGPGQRVADPFCGTGGLLLEAAMLGAEVRGGDLDPAKAEGSRATLAHFGLRGEVRVGDVADTLRALPPLDAVVSDPPYGRASTTAREEPRALHARALAAMADAVRPGGRVAIVLPDADADRLAPPGLALEQRHVQRVHRSLDRHYLVFQRR
jgi:tRNA (guanine10-N2)-dimethyltransferase